MPTARTLEAQTLLIVSEETSFGMPPLICAWREGIWPCPACRTWPMITCWTSSPPTSARSSAALIAMPPSSVASSVDRPPPIFPIGVRAEPRMTVLGMAVSLSVGGVQECAQSRWPRAIRGASHTRASAWIPWRA